MVMYRQPNMRPQAARRTPVPSHTLAFSVLTPLFSASRDPLLLIDNNQLLRAANPAACELLQLREQDICNRPWRESFQLERELSRAWQHNPVVACLQTRREQPLESGTRLICGDQRIALEGRVLPVTQGQRDLALLWCYPLAEEAEARSVSRRHEHELLLQHMSRLNTVSELATGIAHEMNQPLSAIMSFNQAALRLLADDEPDIDRVAEALAEAVNQTRRAADILERLRAFVGRQDLNLRPVAVNQVVINALTLLSNKLTEAGVRVSLRTEPCPPVRADALQLEQVMVNLVRNAVEAMQATAADARTLHIATRTLAGQVHVAVTDSGPGLPAGSQLFSRFFTTKTDGMGLGLSISRTILEAAGGELSADNAPGGGACFRFVLPAFITEEIRHGHPAL